MPPIKIGRVKKNKLKIYDLRVADPARTIQWVSSGSGANTREQPGARHLRRFSILTE
jgi:hypothetical protein